MKQKIFFFLYFLLINHSFLYSSSKLSNTLPSKKFVKDLAKTIFGDGYKDIPGLEGNNFNFPQEESPSIPVHTQENERKNPLAKEISPYLEPLQTHPSSFITQLPEDILSTKDSESPLLKAELSSLKKEILEEKEKVPPFIQKSSSSKIDKDKSTSFENRTASVYEKKAKEMRMLEEYAQDDIQNLKILVETLDQVKYALSALVKKTIELFGPEQTSSLVSFMKKNQNAKYTSVKNDKDLELYLSNWFMRDQIPLQIVELIYTLQTCIAKTFLDKEDLARSYHHQTQQLFFFTSFNTLNANDWLSIAFHYLAKYAGLSKEASTFIDKDIAYILTYNVDLTKKAIDRRPEAPSHHKVYEYFINFIKEVLSTLPIKQIAVTNEHKKDLLFMGRALRTLLWKINDAKIGPLVIFNEICKQENIKTF